MLPYRNMRRWLFMLLLLAGCTLSAAYKYYGVEFLANRDGVTDYYQLEKWEGEDTTDAMRLWVRLPNIPQEDVDTIRVLDIVPAFQDGQYLILRIRAVDTLYQEVSPWTYTAAFKKGIAIERVKWLRLIDD